VTSVVCNMSCWQARNNQVTCHVQFLLPKNSIWLYQLTCVLIYLQSLVDCICLYIVSAACQEDTKNFITSVVIGKDCVPRCDKHSTLLSQSVRIDLYSASK